MALSLNWRSFERSLLLLIFQFILTSAFPQRIALLSLHKNQQSSQEEVQLLERIETEMERRQMYEELKDLHSSHSTDSNHHHHSRKTRRSKRVMEQFDPRKQQEESAKRYSRIGGSIIMGKRR